MSRNRRSTAPPEPADDRVRKSRDADWCAAVLRALASLPSPPTPSDAPPPPASPEDVPRWLAAFLGAAREQCVLECERVGQHWPLNAPGKGVGRKKCVEAIRELGRPR